jgi:glycerophosphoryl diester phosphodiesterase
MKYISLILMLSFQSTAQDFDWQGHRGCRGILPENSLQAFEKALELGVKTLEMDVVISKDGEVIVSHDPWISPDFCLGPENRSIEGDESDWPNIYQLTYGEILKYDCGSKGNAKFPNQSKQQAFKPRLVDVFKMAEKYCKDQRRNEVYYNIEIKSNPEWDGKYHPAYYDFSDIVYSTIDAYVPWRRVNIQSFDHRILQYFHKTEIYSPHFKLLKQKKVKWLHDNGVKVIVWTVNTREDMEKMIAMGVDGIITDYPDLIEDLSRKQ